MTYNTNVGTHSRNKKNFNPITCADCPKRESCTEICREMNRHLEANGNTISHNSPKPFGCEDGILDKILLTSGKSKAADTPESLLLAKESNDKAVEAVLHHIDAFSRKASKGVERQRSIVESILVLHYLEDYGTTRIAELLGELYEEFRGVEEFQRKKERTDREGHENKDHYAPIRRQRGTDKVSRILSRSQEFIRSSELSKAIHQVMVECSFKPMQPFVA